MHLPATQAFTQTTEERILGLILRHSLGEAEPQEQHLAKIRRAIKLGQPLQLVLPAFPAKSANREKTIGPLADYAEVLGLERLQELCDAIREWHAPGAQVLICSDGRVFSDLVMVHEEHVTLYGRSIAEIIQNRGFRDLRILDLEWHYGGGSFAHLRERLVRDFGRSVEEVRLETLEATGARAMFNGIHRFLFEDLAALEPHKSRNRLREESKQLTYHVIQRSNAWSALVENRFPQAVRLSIHPQPPRSPKIGFQLVTSENIWGTPWHNVALLGKGGFRLAKHREARSAGATLEYAQGKYAYYREAAL